MSNNTKINCPNCKHEFDIETALRGDLEKQIEAKLKTDLRDQMKVWQADQQLAIKQKEADLEAKSKQLKEDIEAENQKRRLEQEQEFTKRQNALVEEIKEKYKNENQELFDRLKKDNEEQTQKIIDLKKIEAENLSNQQKLATQMAEFEVEKKKLAFETEQKITEKIRFEEQSKTDLKIKEYEKQFLDQQKLIEEMQRKAEQGSMQLQGEVQELAIEEWILSKFPYDQLEEIKKGQRGGDCIQNVFNTSGMLCGKIYYESKRTKNFDNSWIEKFKDDMRTVNADLGVIVTQTMPKDMPKFGQKEGVWICTFEEFKNLSYVLREMLIKVGSVKIVQANKGDKMSILYDYLTSPEFKMSIENIVEGFSSLQDGLMKERRAMEKIWKEREKQIDKVMESTVGMYGSIKGIAGSAVQDIKLLELADDLDTDD
jgi:hypothetical protein